MLRNEVAHLKQLLLAHKDCPVTTLQKKTAYLGEPFIIMFVMFVCSLTIAFKQICKHCGTTFKQQR